MKKEKNHIISLIVTQKSGFSKWFSIIGLTAGVLLLLACIQMYIDIDRLLNKSAVKKGAYDYISVTKEVTNENMGKINTFSTDEITELKSQPFVSDVGPLISNQFRVKASAGSVIPFSTDLFLETVSPSFLDTLPDVFKWAPGQDVIPIIFSSDFLEMYNVFAPAQGLPQLSEKTISSVNIVLECSGNGKTSTFRGNIVGLSDRINSILVPPDFMNWANSYFSNHNTQPPERMYLKTKDANEPRLLNYIAKKNYRINKDKTKFGRAKNILDNIISGLGVLGLLVIGLALLLFSFYLKLMISEKKYELSLLMLLGYSPNWISKQVAKKWIGIYFGVILTSLALTTLINYIFVNNALIANQSLSFLPDWKVFLTALFLLILSINANYFIVKRNLIRIAENS